MVRMFGNDRQEGGEGRENVGIALLKGLKIGGRSGK